MVLRNNRTTEGHPLGLFHPHAEYHHIKRENIGLIEVMGLAVLPSRLQAEFTALIEAILSGADIRADATLSKHADWVEKWKGQYTFTQENAMEILKKETGKVFVAVLEDAGVYKCTSTGRAQFQNFIESVNGK